MKLILFSLIAGGLLACTKKNTALEKASFLHKEMFLMLEEVEKELSLLSPTKPLQDSMVQIKKEIEEWKASVIEVPGNTEVDHDHHAHSHEKLNLTDDELLAVQLELKNELEKIKKRIKKLLQHEKSL